MADAESSVQRLINQCSKATGQSASWSAGCGLVMLRPECGCRCRREGGRAHKAASRIREWGRGVYRRVRRATASPERSRCRFQTWTRRSMYSRRASRLLTNTFRPQHYLCYLRSSPSSSPDMVWPARPPPRQTHRRRPLPPTTQLPSMHTVFAKCSWRSYPPAGSSTDSVIAGRRTERRPVRRLYSWVDSRSGLGGRVR